MLYQESLQTAEASLKGSLMAQLIEGDGGRQTILSDQSLRYGVDLRLPYRMLLGQHQKWPTAAIDPRLPGLINQVLAQNEAQAVAAQFAGQVAILAQADQPVEELARALLERLAS